MSTLAALAERAGISRIYVQALERGARQFPSWPVLKRLAAASQSIIAAAPGARSDSASGP